MFIAGKPWLSLFLGLSLWVAAIGAAGAGETEKWVQESLNALGYEVGAADGVMGRRSKAALMAFQADKSLSPTGEIDKPTIKALGIAARCETGAYKAETEEPLFGAAFCNDLDHLAVLLAGGADPKEITKRGQTPLMMAARLGHYNFMQPLVDAGVEINHIAENGYTALMFAAAYGQTDAAGALLEAGADKFLPRQGRVTAASLAREAGDNATLTLVRLDFDDSFRSCVMGVAGPVLAGLPIELSWLSNSGELDMRYASPPTLFTAVGMPLHVLSIVDSVIQRDGAADGLVKTCGATCGSYCLAE